jgi:hypothetical protein
MNIKKINAKQVVLISTIDVYKDPFNVDEETLIDTDGLHPYGMNRYILEQWVEREYNESLIVRLPGLYGKNIKKNFIYDMIHIIPKMLKPEKFQELCNKDSAIKDYYKLQENGFYQCNKLTNQERIILKDYFNTISFSALNFTDSRGSFQFYNLGNLWTHIKTALNNELHILNLSTEPVTINEIYKSIYCKDFNNEISQDIPNYNFKTKYAELFSGSNGYIFTKDKVLKDIKRFVEDYTV